MKSMQCCSMPVTPVLEEAAQTICCLVNAVSKCQSTFILMIFLYLQTFQWRQKGELSTNYQFWTDLKTKVVVIISYQTKCTLSAGNQFWKSSKQCSIFGRLGDQWIAISSPGFSIKFSALWQPRTSDVTHDFIIVNLLPLDSPCNLHLYPSHFFLMFWQHIRHIWLCHGLYFGGSTRWAQYTAKQL